MSAASTAGAGFAYDQAGNVLYDGINNYWYNAEGQLCAVYKTSGSVTMYSYDAEGRRVAKGTLSALPSNGAAYGNVPTNSSCGPVPPVTSSTTGFTLGSQYLLDLGGNQATELNTQNGTASVPLGWATLERLGWRQAVGHLRHARRPFPAHRPARHQAHPGQLCRSYG